MTLTLEVEDGPWVPTTNLYRDDAGRWWAVTVQTFATAKGTDVFLVDSNWGCTYDMTTGEPNDGLPAFRLPDGTTFDRALAVIEEAIESGQVVMPHYPPPPEEIPPVHLVGRVETRDDLPAEPECMGVWAVSSTAEYAWADQDCVMQLGPWEPDAAGLFGVELSDVPVIDP